MLGIFKKKTVRSPLPVSAVTTPRVNATADERVCAVFNCATANYQELGASPYFFGTEPDSNATLGDDLQGVVITLVWTLGRCQLVVKTGSAEIRVNGQVFKGGFFGEKEEEYTLQIGSACFFLIKCGKAETLRHWKEAVSTPRWYLHHWNSEEDFHSYLDSLSTPAPIDNCSETLGPLSFQHMVERLSGHPAANGKTLVSLHGSNAAFYAEHLRGAAPKAGHKPEGKLRCPRCLQRFDLGDMLAVHPIQRGDTELGERELMRFLPTKFGTDGRALDDDDRPCSDWACPHCRGKLPPGFHESPMHIISLVGDSMAGKSYYLAITIKTLKRVLFRSFGVNFSDADASQNSVLNNMIQTLDTARSAAEAVLQKTPRTGETYANLKRYGEDAMLPQPFAYRALREEKGAATLVFYDNAGEHFQPQVAEREKAAATEHLAWSSATMFLFDPVRHHSMLKLLNKSADPQVASVRESKMRCEQDVILAEIGSRIHQWKGLRNDIKADMPFALVMGKYDLWEFLLPKTELRQDLVVDGKLNADAILANSRKVRHFMMEHCPEIVGAAEMISSKVVYFPASAFGTAAVSSKDEGGRGQIGPDPGRLEPFLVEVPVLWALSCVAPDLLPST